MVSYDSYVLLQLKFFTQLLDYSERECKVHFNLKELSKTLYTFSFLRDTFSSLNFEID